MADQYRHSGVGWANGPVDNVKILALPSPDLLLLSSEHWHHDEAVRAGKRVLFRGMARRGFRPAEVGWNARRYVDEITRDAVRVSEPITDFVAWNELNLQDERGDTWSDHGDLTDLYSLLGQFLLGVISELRQRPSTRAARLHFGAWAPKDETDYTDHWRAAADLCDVMDVHAYGPGPGIIGHIEKYRALFPGKPLALTEWHSDFAGPEEDRRTLELLADYAAERDWFRAYYFAWRWDGAPTHQQDMARAIAVEGNPDRLSLFRDPPLAAAVPPVDPPPPDPPEEPKPVMTIYQDFNRVESIRRGIDPAVSERAWNTEGGLTEPARLGDFSGSPWFSGKSWYAGQLHWGGKGYEHFGHTAGMGNGFTAFTGWEPGDPKAWRDALRYCLDEVRRGGWGPWYGPKKIGIVGFMGVDRSVPWGGTPADEWDFRTGGAPVPKVTFNAAEPAHPQDKSFDCSQEALEWALWALGRKPADSWLEATMIAEGVMSAADGLLDATGAGLAAFVRRQYGEFGFDANHEPSVTWEALVAETNPNPPYPILLGGRAWGHWSGVRGFNGMLLLANPSEGWKGVRQTMSRAQWDALGPFSMVRVLHPDLLAPAPIDVPPPPLPQKLTLEDLLAGLRSITSIPDDRLSGRAIRAEIDALLTRA